MKILICSSYKDAWNSVRPEGEIFIEIARLGHDVTLITQADAEYVPRFRSEGVRVVDRYPRSKVDLSAIGAMRRELRESRHDVFYAMNSRAICNAALACLGLPVKFVTYRGTVSGLYRHDPTVYLTHLNPRVDGIICNSNAVRDYVRRQLWRRIPVETVYKGQSLEWFDVAPADRGELGIPGAAFVLLCVANARPSKGLDVLLRATGSLGDIEGLHLVIAGRGTDSAAYRAAAGASPMAGRIHLLGPRGDVPALMAAADAYVQPSVSGEGFPKTVCEAMGVGLPVIVTTTGGARELVAEDRNGYVVEVRDAAAIAARVRQLAGDRARARAMGAAGRQTVAERLSPRRAAEAHLRFFERLLAGD